jgi:hypothetical protein
MTGTEPRSRNWSGMLARCMSTTGETSTIDMRIGLVRKGLVADSRNNVERPRSDW